MTRLSRHPLMRLILSSTATGLIMALAGCGGGDAGRPAHQANPPGEPLITEACPDCRSGHLEGLAAAGAAMAWADVTAVDGQGGLATTRTDAQGRYTLDVSALRAPLIVIAHGSLSGQALALHAVVLPAEVGRARTHLTPFSELIAARVLRGLPHDLLRQGRADLRHITTAVVRTAEAELEALLRPLLHAAGVPGAVDLRAGAFEADHTGVDRALDWLVFSQEAGGYRLRHLLAAPVDAVAFDAQGDTDADTLPAPPSIAPLTDGMAALPEIEARLSALTAAFAQAVPPASALAPFLSSDFLHEGLGATQYIARILRQQDPTDAGGFSLRGARWDQPRLVQIADADQLLVQFRVTPRAPFDAFNQTLWMVRSANGWSWRGDRTLAQVSVRQAAVLGPRALTLAEVRALPGMACTTQDRSMAQQAWTDTRCQAASTDGMLDAGFAGDARFGMLAMFASSAATPSARRTQAALRSTLLGTPSAQVTSYLRFDIDRRRIDARVAEVRVTGPGLPAHGLSLAPPGEDNTEATHWAWAHHPDDDWPAVPIGWCPSDEPMARAACDDGWRALGSGATYHFTLLDANALVLGEQRACLPPQPLPAAALLAEASHWFARWQIGATSAASPALGRVLGLEGPGPLQGVAVWTLPWSSPSTGSPRQIEARLALALHPDDDTEPSRLHHHRVMPRAAGLDTDLQHLWPLDPLRHTAWASARLETSDRWGHRYVHAVAPHNPR